jgi:hypothetical protein
MSSLNWADLVKDAGEGSGSYEPLPDGDYDLKIVEAPAKTTSTGKTMFAVKAQVQSGPHANRLIWDNITISPENKNALAIFFSKMVALGIPREFFTTNNPSNAQIEATLQGRTFRAQIASEVYQGSRKNKINRYYVTTPGVTAAPVAAAPVADAFVAPPVAAFVPAPAPAPAPAYAPPVVAPAPVAAPAVAPF